MKQILVAAACAAAALAVPSLASAQSPSPAPNAAMMATMMCRPAAASEKPNAMMVAGNTGLVCKPMTGMKDGKLVSGPDLSKALTPEQANAAWQSWLMSMMMVNTGGG